MKNYLHLAELSQHTRVTTAADFQTDIKENRN